MLKHNFLMFFINVRNLWFRLSGQPDVGMLKDAAKASEMASDFLKTNGDTLGGIFNKTESARCLEEVKCNFHKVNQVMLYFLSEVKGKDGFWAIKRCLEELGISKRFSECLEKASSLREAIEMWKTNIVMNISVKVKRREKERVLNEDFDNELISRFLTCPTSPAPSRKRSLKESTFKADERMTERKRAKLSKGEYYVESRRRENNFDEKDYHIMRRENLCISYQFNSCFRKNTCKFKHIKY